MNDKISIDYRIDETRNGFELSMIHAEGYDVEFGDAFNTYEEAVACAEGDAAERDAVANVTFNEGTKVERFNVPTTFEDFQASRKIEENLEDVFPATFTFSDAIGLSYLNGRYYIEKQFEQDAIHAELHNVHYVVTVGNQQEDFGSNLEAAERFLWNEFARGEENWQHVRFDTEFGSDYQLDQGQVLDLIDFGFTDNSWHNDICPCFDLHLDTDHSGREFYVRIWFDAPNPEDREAGPEQPQFAVGLYVDGELLDESYPYPSMFETDDFYLALAYALGKAAKSLEWGDDVQIDCENKFGILLVDWILPKALAEKWETYALKATTDEMVDYGIELVAKRGESKRYPFGFNAAFEKIVQEVIEDRDDIQYFCREEEQVIERPDGGFEVHIPVAAWFDEDEKIRGGVLTIEITEDPAFNDSYANWE